MLVESKIYVYIYNALRIETKNLLKLFGSVQDGRKVNFLSRLNEYNLMKMILTVLYVLWLSSGTTDDQTDREAVE